MRKRRTLLKSPAPTYCSTSARDTRNHAPPQLHGHRNGKCPAQKKPPLLRYHLQSPSTRPFPIVYYRYHIGGLKGPHAYQTRPTPSSPPPWCPPRHRHQDLSGTKNG